MIKKELLERLYLQEGKSMQEISVKMKCSLHRVSYWMKKHDIKKRTISDAIYAWHNPSGDPFRFNPPVTPEDYKLFGMGLGLYWGEGNKANLYSVRLGNTDPELLRTFINFLDRFFGVKKEELSVGLQIFSDIDEKQAVDYWSKKLKLKKNQFKKVVVTISGSLGTYRKKSQYGVLTVYYCNTKLRNLLINMLPM